MNTQPAAPLTTSKTTLTPVEQYIVGVIAQQLVDHVTTLHRFFTTLQAL